MEKRMLSKRSNCAFSLLKVISCVFFLACYKSDADKNDENDEITGINKSPITKQTKSVKNDDKQETHKSNDVTSISFKNGKMKFDGVEYPLNSIEQLSHASYVLRKIKILKDRKVINGEIFITIDGNGLVHIDERYQFLIHSLSDLEDILSFLKQMKNLGVKINKIPLIIQNGQLKFCNYFIPNKWVMEYNVWRIVNDYWDCFDVNGPFEIFIDNGCINITGIGKTQIIWDLTTITDQLNNVFQVSQDGYIEKVVFGNQGEIIIGSIKNDLKNLDDFFEVCDQIDKLCPEEKFHDNIIIDWEQKGVKICGSNELQIDTDKKMTILLYCLDDLNKTHLYNSITKLKLSFDNGTFKIGNYLIPSQWLEDYFPLWQSIIDHQDLFEVETKLKITPYDLNQQQCIKIENLETKIRWGRFVNAQNEIRPIYQKFFTL